MVKRIYYPNNSFDRIELAAVLIAYAAAIGIGIMFLYTVAPVMAITGDALNALSGGGNSSLTVITNESSNHSPYNKVWPNIHSNVKTDFNANISLPEIQDTAFIHPFAVVIGNCYIGKLVMVAPTAV